MSEQEPDVGGVKQGQRPGVIRTIDDIGTLKVLADPIRLAIMSALMKARELPVMSVKEIAAELGEPQTKLYRHVRQLEGAGLIRVAATRVVSGIIEQRYQACQRDIMVGPGMLSSHPGETDEAFRTVLDRFRDGFMTARLAANATGAGPHRKPLVYLAEVTVSPAAAAELERRLADLKSWLDQAMEDPGDVPVSVLLGFYSEER